MKQIIVIPHHIGIHNNVCFLQVDPSGPLATLRKLLLSDESIASFKRWVTDHWYAVLLIVFAVLFILVSTASQCMFLRNYASKLHLLNCMYGYSCSLKITEIVLI